MPYSAEEIIRAIERQGYVCKSGKGKRGSHRTWARPRAAGEFHATVTLAITAKEIPAGTLSSILRQLGIDRATLDGWIRGK